MQAFTKRDSLYNSAANVLFNEDVPTIKAAVEKLKVGDKTNFGVITAIGDSSVSFKARDTGVTRIAFNDRKLGTRDFVLDKLIKLKEEVEIDEAKGADPANLRAIIANHTALLSKADKPEAKDFHKTAIANAKEKLKALGEEVELSEEYKTRSPKVAKIMDQIDALSGGEWLDYWKSLQQYAQDFADGNGEDDTSYGVIAGLLTKVVKEYQTNINY